MTDDQQGNNQPSNGTTPERPPLLVAKHMRDGQFDVNAADESYRSIISQRQKLEDDLKAKDARIQEMEALFARGVGRPDSNQHGTAWDRLGEYALPTDTLREAVTEAAREVVKEAISPLFTGIEARKKVAATFSDYAQIEPQVMGYIESDPELSAQYNRHYKADPQGALEWAVLRYKYDDASRQGGQTSTDLGNERVAAGLPGSRTSATRTTVPDMEREKSALDYAHQTGNARAYFNERLKDIVPD